MLVYWSVGSSLSQKTPLTIPKQLVATNSSQSPKSTRNDLSAPHQQQKHTLKHHMDQRGKADSETISNVQDPTKQSKHEACSGSVPADVLEERTDP